MKKLTCANFVNVGEVAVFELGEFKLLPASGNGDLRFFNSVRALIQIIVYSGIRKLVAFGFSMN